jgi:glycosyltransferase involved in cell wall biosynthesis
VEPQSSELVVEQRSPGSLPRVLIDGRKIGDGGIGVYIDNIVRGFLAMQQFQVTILSTEAKAGTVDYRGDVSWIYDDARPYSADEMLLLPRRVQFERFDLFHTPHYMLPFRIPIPTVVTIHDLIHITHPEKFYYPTVAKLLIRSAAKRAAGIIAVSRDTRRAVLELTGVPEEKVWHIPNAISSSVVCAPQVRPALAKKYADLGPFLLSVFSNIKPHKALRDLLDAFKALRSRHSVGAVRGLKLVLVGYGTEDILSSPELLDLVGEGESVHIMGSVSNEELSLLYSRARVVVIPSLAEGFCIPALEAQALGVPIVCRPVPALLELVSECDLVASDMSVDALARVVAEAAERFGESSHRGIDHSAARGIAASRLAEFGRSRIASQTAQLYADLLARRGR